jgi:hypothetical protein
MERKLYAELASRIHARKACQGTNAEWFEKHSETIKLLVDLLPSGSGFDNGTKIDLEASHAEKLVFYTSFHHMDENGSYSGWTEHTIVVTPSLQHKINLRISGQNRNEVKDAIHEAFYFALTQDVTYNLYLPMFPELAVTSKWEDKDGSASQCYQAFYTTDGGRFWNDLESAKKHAAELMEKKFFGRK